MTVLMYSNCLNLFSNREEKKAMVSLQIAELFVLLRTSGLENSVWDDYQEWLKSKGAALLFLSLFWLKSHLKTVYRQQGLDSEAERLADGAPGKRNCWQMAWTI